MSRTQSLVDRAHRAFLKKLAADAETVELEQPFAELLSRAREVSAEDVKTILSSNQTKETISDSN